MNASIPGGAAHILERLNGAGYEAWLVGGCVRDLLRGVPPHDWDICTSARPEETQRCFRERRLIETGLKHGTVTVLVEGVPYEITTYRAEGPYSDCRRPDYVRFVSSLEADLSRRDFTMNAIALGRDGTLRDPFGGAADIRAETVRCVGLPERRFQEDGLRLLRALRFSAALGFSIEPATAQAIHQHRSVLGCVAAERVQTELCKLLSGAMAGAVLRAFPDVLWRFWPELEPLSALAQNNPWHCWDAWEHTLHTVDAIAPDPVLRLTMLLHDIGKPACQSADSAGIDHFFGHPDAGARLADQMLRRLKFDNLTRKRVVTLVQFHDVQLPVQNRAVRRWLNRLGPEVFFQLLEVKRADVLGQSPGRAQERLAELAALRAKAEAVLAQGQCISLKDLAVNGRDVIAAGTPPGPAVGRVLHGLLDRVLSGELPNERDVLLTLLRTEAPA